MAKHTNLKVYFFNELDNADLFNDSFHSFSYGDADVTCVRRSAIVAELLTKDNVEPLIREIESLEGEDILIAF